MRFLVLILIFGLSMVKAQNLKPACQVGATWNYIYTTGGTAPAITSLQTIQCIRDTTIGNHRVSVLKADTGMANSIKFYYLAKDDSDGLYFFPLFNNTLDPNPLLTFRFQDSLMQPGYFFTHYRTQFEEIFLKGNSRIKEYTNQDSQYFYIGLGSNWAQNSNPMHPKFLNLYFGTLDWQTAYFGILDFSRSFDSDYMSLSCYTDSSGTTKFIKAYADKGCDYVGLPQIVTNKDNLTVFPNPCNDRFFITTTFSQNEFQTVVRNILGETMPNASNFKEIMLHGVNTSNWPEGIYFCTFKSNSNTEIKKLVVRH